MNRIEVAPNRNMPPEFNTYGVVVLIVIVLGLLHAMFS